MEYDETSLDIYKDGGAKYTQLLALMDLAHEWFMDKDIQLHADAVRLMASFWKDWLMRMIYMRTPLLRMMMGC